MAKKLGGLGKGLNAIFIENDNEENNGPVTIKISEIEPNRSQPRKEFDEEALNELADSIAKHGLLQPLLVRPLTLGGYEIVAGERRYRASRMAGLTEVPVVIRELSEAETMELALIENLQREDLTPLEEAMGYSVLMDEHGFTQEEVARSVGKSRPAVANALRLLKLPESVTEALKEEKISAGHARAAESGKRSADAGGLRTDHQKRSFRSPDGKALQKAERRKETKTARRKSSELLQGSGADPDRRAGQKNQRHKVQGQAGRRTANRILLGRGIDRVIQ